MRVRIKELAQEAKFIRLEENRIKSKQKIKMPFYGYVDGRYISEDTDSKSKEFMQLRGHRIHDVRNAARAAQLAYGFMRDVPYRTIEQTTKPIVGFYEVRKWEAIVKEVKRLATKFSEHNTKFDKEIDAWFKV